MAQRLPTESVRRAVELYASGLSLAKVAGEIGCSTATVYRHVQRSGVRLRPMGLFRNDVDSVDLVRLRNLGHSWGEVGAAVGMSADGARSRYLRATRDLSRSGTGRMRLRQAQDATWARHWADVRTFHQLNGRWPTARTGTETALTRWVAAQRRAFRTGALDEARRVELERSGLQLGLRQRPTAVLNRYGHRRMTDEELSRLVGLGATRRQIADNSGLTIAYVGRRIRGLS